MNNATVFAPLMVSFQRLLIEFKKEIVPHSPFCQTQKGQEMEKSIDRMLREVNRIADFLDFLTEPPLSANTNFSVIDWEQILKVPLGASQKKIVEFFRGNNNTPTQLYPLYLEMGKWFGAGVLYILNSQLKTANCPVRIRQLPVAECEAGVVKYKFYNL